MPELRYMSKRETYTQPATPKSGGAWLEYNNKWGLAWI